MKCATASCCAIAEDDDIVSGSSDKKDVTVLCGIWV